MLKGKLPALNLSKIHHKTVGAAMQAAAGVNEIGAAAGGVQATEINIVKKDIAGDIVQLYIAGVTAGEGKVIQSLQLQTTGKIHTLDNNVVTRKRHCVGKLGASGIGTKHTDQLIVVGTAHTQAAARDDKQVVLLNTGSGMLTADKHHARTIARAVNRTGKTGGAIGCA